MARPNWPAPSASICSEALAGDIVSQNYRTLMKRALANATGPEVFVFRCDSANEMRQFRMTISCVQYPGQSPKLLFHILPVSKTVRPPMDLFDGAVRKALLGEESGKKLVRICSYCLKVHDDAQDCWIEPEAYYRAGGSGDVQLQSRHLPRLLSRDHRTGERPARAAQIQPRLTPDGWAISCFRIRNFSARTPAAFPPCAQNAQIKSAPPRRSGCFAGREPGTNRTTGGVCVKVIVLGSGVIGVSTAYYLAQAGHQVAVIDRRAGAGLETSFANAGEISPGYSAPWAAPGLPLKAIKWLFMHHRPLVIRPKPDIPRWPCGANSAAAQLHRRTL